MNFVKDEGLGIPDEDQSHLFQTFFRANNSPGIQGTGMGLYIIKRYLDIMGGLIQFTSKLNKGSILLFSSLHRNRQVQTNCSLCADTIKKVMTISIFPDCGYLAFATYLRILLRL